MTLDKVTIQVQINGSTKYPHTINHFTIKGKSWVPDAPPIVFIPHTSLEVDAYSETAQHLCVFGNVYIPSLKPIVGIDASQTDLLSAYLQSQKFSKFSLIGHRYGSVVASEFAQEQIKNKNYSIAMLTLLDPGAVDLDIFNGEKVEVITSKDSWDRTYVAGSQPRDPLHIVHMLDLYHNHDLYETVTLDSKLVEKKLGTSFK